MYASCRYYSIDSKNRHCILFYCPFKNSKYSRCIRKINNKLFFLDTKYIKCIDITENERIRTQGRPVGGNVCVKSVCLSTNRNIISISPLGTIGVPESPQTSRKDSIMPNRGV